MQNIKGRWILVTGSTRGIGRALAGALAGLGGNVVVHGRSAAAALDAAAALGNTTGRCIGVGADLGREDGADELLAQLRKANVDQIDILFNNAAINEPPQDVFDFNPGHWQRTLQVNLLAPAALCAALVPGMVERRWGRVVNMTSGIAGQPERAAYSASKAALDKYTQDLASAVREHNVLVNRVDPGWIRTDMGGPDAWSSVSSVLPGVLMPALLDDGGPTGRLYEAQDFSGLRLPEKN